MIEVTQIRKSYGKKKVLSDITFQVKPGECVAIAGKNGCGKSTFLRCLNRLEIPSSGSIKFEGTEVDEAHIDAVRQKMGMVFQHFNLFPHLTVKKNLELAPTLLKLKDKQAISDKADELLARVGLSDKADAYPKSLSGGQQQRIAIARAIVNRPVLLLADEPTGNLDQKNAEDIMRLLERINGQGTTVLVVSHNQELVRSMHRRQVVLRRGQVARDLAREAAAYGY